MQNTGEKYRMVVVDVEDEDGWPFVLHRRRFLLGGWKIVHWLFWYIELMRSCFTDPRLWSQVCRRTCRIRSGRSRSLMAGWAHMNNGIMGPTCTYLCCVLLRVFVANWWTSAATMADRRRGHPGHHGMHSQPRFQNDRHESGTRRSVRMNRLWAPICLCTNRAGHCCVVYCKHILCPLFKSTIHDVINGFMMRMRLFKLNCSNIANSVMLCQRRRKRRGRRMRWSITGGRVKRKYYKTWDWHLFGKNMLLLLFSCLHWLHNSTGRSGRNGRLEGKQSDRIQLKNIVLSHLFPILHFFAVLELHSTLLI